METVAGDPAASIGTAVEKVLPPPLLLGEASSYAAPPTRAHSSLGIAQGPVGGEVVVTIARDASPDAIEIRIGKDSYVPSSAEPDDGGPLLDANQILGSDFSEGVGLWRSPQPKVGWVVGLDHPSWALRASHTAFIRQDVAEVGSPMELVYDSGLPGGLIPLRPGASYQLSGLFGSHRCSGEIGVRVLDPAGKILGAASRHPAPAFLGGEEASGYDRIVLDFVAPGQPCFAQIFLSKGETKKGADSWFFFTHLFFARVDSPGSRAFQPCRFPPATLGVLQRLDVAGSKQIRIALPPAYDTADVVERATGLPLVGSPLEMEGRIQAEGAITGREDTSIVGWARDTNNPFIPLRVSLFVDGRERLSALADQPHGDSRNGFRLPLPTDVLDGQAHWMSIRLWNDQSIAEGVEMLPDSMTPWSALSRHGSTRLPARLSTAASYRYEALREHIEALARTGAKGAAAEAALRDLSQLTVAHERVLAGIDRKLHVLPPLAFPVHKAPKVSVVVPVHNKLEVTHNCLAALLLAYNDTSFEVIVSDDGSTDATTEISELITGITVARNQTAEGFISACNLGASKARGEYIVLLNNDTEPTSRWLDELIHVFENFDGVGLAGSKLLYPDGRLQEAGGIVWGSGNAWNYGRLGNAADPKYNYTRQADYVSGAALMIPTALWKQVGGLSDELRPAYWEDTDLAFKVREAGHRVLYVPHSVVFHFEGISNGTSTASGMKRFQEVNRPKFQRKWRAAYQHNGSKASFEKADFEKDRGIGFRALFIDAQPPRPDRDAGSYAAVQEMRAMQALGGKVTFLPENLAYLGGYTTDLQRAGIETVYVPFASSVEEFLRIRGSEFDVVYITRYMVADRHLEAVRRYAPQAKVLFCNADLHFLRELREAVLANSSEKIEAALATRDAELRVMRHVDVVLSYNVVEHAVIMSHNINSTKVVTAPWIVDIAKEVPRFEARANVAFLGGFAHPPNVEAVRYFVRDVMPLLRRRVPGVNFLIYGSDVPPEIEALGAEDVIVKGYVENLADIYETCRVFVAPLLAGAGVKGKVLDALSFGVPCVLSPVAAEGIGLSEGSDALVARTPAEWADAVAALYGDAARWSTMSERALSFARRNFSFERGVEQMRAAVEAAGLFPDKGMALQRARLGR